MFNTNRLQFIINKIKEILTMKLSKRLTALFAAVLMTVTMFTGAISANAAEYAKTAITPKGIYSNLTITGWRSANSQRKMYAKTTANYSTYRLAVTMVARNVDSKGNLKSTGGSPDKSKDLTNKTPEAYITSGSGNHFTKINIYYAGLTDDNLDHCAMTEYHKTW